MVNEYLQSVSNPAVYAAGDVAASNGLPLTPVASYDGAIAANNLIKGNTIKTSYAGLRSVVFTILPLVSVGMQEKEAKDQVSVLRDGCIFPYNPYESSFSIS
jgi:glutathione reductase (NADPH)